MTRHPRFDVRIAPDVEHALNALAAVGGTSSADAQRLLRALRRLREDGVWTHGSQKMQSLDMWELRAGDYRLFFSPVQGSRRLAVGAITRKARRKLPMRHLRRIEKQVHRWRTEVEEAP